VTECSSTRLSGNCVGWNYVRYRGVFVLYVHGLYLLNQERARGGGGGGFF